MLTVGSLAFATPWVLATLLGLPLLWWILRVTPPAPRRIVFPAVRLVAELLRREETPAHTPLWLLLLRLTLAALIVTALAGPVLNPGSGLTGQGPLVMVIDDGWTAAARWQSRTDAMEQVIDKAARDGRGVILLTTAAPQSGEALAPRLQTAADARATARTLQPKPWPTDRRAALAALRTLRLQAPAESVWLSDGIASPPKTAKEAISETGGNPDNALARYLLALGPVQVLADSPGEYPRALLPPVVDPGGLRIRVLRADGPAAGDGGPGPWVRATAENGAVLGRLKLAFKAQGTIASGLMPLPLEVRNRITRLDIEGEDSAGSTVLLDERWRRRPVGLVSGEGTQEAQPLLTATYYLERALNPFSEVRRGRIDDLLSRKLAVLVLADVGRILEPQRRQLTAWLKRGGVLIRFAGPRLAERSDELIPVRLRRGGRALGGALSWSQPARLAPFEEGSPFFDLAVPDDVLVRRQVLAEPSLDLAAKTWARLEDGTPLVTAERRGRGWLVLVHTTGDTAWTNLPLSGLFVDMLRRMVDLSQGVGATDEQGTLRPISVLDGFGRLAEPGPAVQPIAPADLSSAVIGPRHPPGFYGSNEARQARNLTNSLKTLPALGDLPAGITALAYGRSGEIDLKPWLLLAAFLVGLADIVAALALKGLLRPHRAWSAGASLTLFVVVAIAGTAPDASGQARGDGDAFALAASLETRLAYVITGDDEIDAMSRAGLRGLSQALTVRTAVEPGDPMAVNIERDEILFFPLLYWAVSPTQPVLSDDALAKLDRYMKNGGTVVFDTRDRGLADLTPGGNASGPGSERLRRMLRRLDIPPLVPVPQNHVLTKAFYLMQTFPGRWSGGEVWVEDSRGRANDGVSAIVIGANDWAAAWAVDDRGRPLAAVVPGGELQREQAFRFGVNLVMYALTGNYKADQVHVPALLERLGQ